MTDLKDSDKPEQGHIEPEQVVLSNKIKTRVLVLDALGVGGEISLESDTARNESSTTRSSTTNLSRRRYLDRRDDIRSIRASFEAAQADDYEIKEVMARGAEAVLYRAVCGAFTFCSKSIRNGWNKWLGSSASKGVEEKLDNVSYKTKTRHIQNEYAISQILNEENAMPIVRIYSLRRVRRFGIELGYDLLMEYLSGHDLGDKILGKVLPIEDKIRVMYQAVQALSFMHKKRVIHLDIKPSNFMLVSGKVKLIDFGVSVLAGHHPRAITGTGGYLSPEQVCKEMVDERSDLFALGIAFSVFLGGRPLTQPQDELVTKHCRDEARYHLEHTETPAVADIPALSEMPLITEAIRSCTIMRRDKRMPSCALLLAKLREGAEKYGIALN